MFRAITSLWLLTATFCWQACALDQPQWGQAWSRNMVSEEKGLPDSFDPGTGKNVKWKVRLGTQTHSTPIVAGGRVYIGTNNGEPRDSRHSGDRGVLMCFEEKTGEFLWQLVVPKREEDPYFDWPQSGISSPVTVEGDRVYLVSNRGEVMCLDAQGMANGNDGPYTEEGAHMLPANTNASSSSASNSVSARSTLESGPGDADILWLFDLTSQAGIWSHDAAHSSILILGDHLYLNTGTGVDNTHKRIRTPNAPSLVVLEKRTGRWLARENEHIAPNIFHSTWSSPSFGEVQGKPLIFFAAGNGIAYSFEPLGFQKPASGNDRSSPEPRRVRGLNRVWKFDFDPEAPKTNVHQYNTNRREGPSNFYGMPVLHQNRIYLTGGGDLWWGKNYAWLKCIDASRTGDITTNGLIWSYTLEKHVLSTPAIYSGLVFVADCGRKFHCLNADTGQPLWTHEIKGEVWASPLVADGKVYLGTRAGTFYVFAATKEKKVLNTIEVGTPISATVTAANRTLFVATMTHLIALHDESEVQSSRP